MDQREHMKLSTKARYAVMAMVDMATHSAQETISLSAIAHRQNLPLPYLEQLFAKLRKAGLVNSSRGASGGYILANAPSQTRVLDVIAAVDQPMRATRCKDHSPIGCQTGGTKCLTHDLWEELTTAVHLFLGAVTLDDVCNRRILGKAKSVMNDPLPCQTGGCR